MYEQILYDVQDPVAVITLNRPDSLNALTGRMQREFKHALAAAEDNLRGSGDRFDRCRSRLLRRRRYRWIAVNSGG